LVNDQITATGISMKQ